LRTPLACYLLSLPQNIRRLPPSFVGSLRPYQNEGFSWLVSRYLLGESGVLADVSFSVGARELLWHDGCCT
jgi:hypothetical protein